MSAAAKPKRRRSLSQRSLAVRAEGPLGDALAGALQAPGAGGYRLTHRFHPYPGRFAPGLAHDVLRAVAAPGERVLDPFMGGGTTLVESLLLGLPAIGNDLNPVAALVARERTRPRSPRQARALEGEAERIAALVEGYRRDKRPPRVPHPRLKRLAPEYAPHLLVEMLQLLHLVNALPEGAPRESLRAVFSAGAVKFSNRRSDTRAEAAPTAYPKGAVSRFFVRKAAELARAQAELHRRLPRPRPEVELLQEDARLLPSLGWGAARHVLTSPPYPGVYDYHAHHRLRMDWLELPGEPFHSGEIGARREGAAQTWSAALQDALGTLARVLEPGGHLFLVVADWVHPGAAGARPHGVDAAGQVLRLAGRKGWACASRAAVQRAPVHKAEQRAFARHGKWEHLLHLQRPHGPA